MKGDNMVTKGDDIVEKIVGEKEGIGWGQG